MTSKQEALEAYNKLENELREFMGDHSFEVSHHTKSQKIRTALEQLANPWQPIETAPKRCWILIYVYGCVLQVCWDHRGWWSTHEYNSRILPDAVTDWQPLPDHPDTPRRGESE